MTTSTLSRVFFKHLSPTLVKGIKCSTEKLWCYLPNKDADQEFAEFLAFGRSSIHFRQASVYRRFNLWILGHYFGLYVRSQPDVEKIAEL